MGTGYNRLVDENIQPFIHNIDGADEIGIIRKIAIATGEIGLRLTVGFRNIMAGWTFPTRIPRVDIDYGNAGQFCLIFDKAIELSESQLPNRPLSVFLTVCLARMPLISSRATAL